MATPPVFSAGAVLTAAQMNKVGLWLIDEVDFSAVSSFTADSVFTSDFVNYRLMCDVTACTGGAAEIQVVLRTSGSDNTTSNYKTAGFATPWTGPVSSTTTATTRANWYVWRTNGSTSLGGSFAGHLDIFGPQLSTQYTYAAGSRMDAAEMGNISHLFQLTTQFDGFKVQNSGGGNMTGRLAIYGYRGD